MSSSIIPDRRWPLVSSAQLKAEIDLAKSSQAELRNILPERIYWLRAPGGRKILWNLELVRDWLVNGESEDHSRAVEAFLGSLASNQPMLSGRRKAA